MNTHRIVHKDTIALVTADEVLISVAETEIRKARLDLEEYMETRPLFRYALSPFPEDPKAPPIARRMIRAAARAGVGPMAAVAGATAEAVLRAMIKAGAKHAVISNGGDIAMILDRPITVGIFTGRSEEQTIALRIPPRRGIIAVCTSSGTVGHSLSFGQADAATVVARDAALADAAATALGNAVQRRSEAGLLNALEKIRIPGIEGMLAVAGAHVAAKGRLPEIVRTRIGKATLNGHSEEKSASNGKNQVRPACEEQDFSWNGYVPCRIRTTQKERNPS
ncbi:MAG: UPF0280 family protein [Acidobacteriota bacterium]|nr:UPF0280 family protein [Acidobacteriota bacterium]